MTDSGAAVNALLYGVKTNTGTIGVCARVTQNSQFDSQLIDNCPSRKFLYKNQFQARV